MSRLRLPRLSRTPNLTYNLKNINELIADKNEEAIILEAIRVGFLVYPSEQLIWDAFKKQVDHEQVLQEKLIKKEMITKRTVFSMEQSMLMWAMMYDPARFTDFKMIDFLNMSSLPLIEIGEISLCTNLKILNLANNYLINISPLSQCVHLFKLDLQNNQIVGLPGVNFWSSFRHLKVLLLHNNPIGRLENLKCLAGSPTLEVLTMYDSPICLKYSYRHHAVNSIMSLKALDNYVVSDEEIIEEAQFNNKFGAKSDVFRIDLNVQAEENSYKSELKATLDLIHRVNSILSHNSPVLILQRFTRGFLVRKKNPSQKNSKIDTLETISAIKIQKWWRSVNLNRRSKDLETPLSYDESESYKNYIPNRVNNTPNPNYQKRIIIDLFKIGQSSILEQSEDKETDRSPKLKPAPSNNDLSPLPKLTLADLNEKKIDSQKLISRIMSAMSRSLQKNSHSSNKDEPIAALHISNGGNEEDENSTNFRLPSLQTNNKILRKKENYIDDLVKEKVTGAGAVKQMQNDIHKLILEKKDEAYVVKKEQLVTNDQRLFQKLYGNMSFGCLRAVDKAYEDRNVADRKFVKKRTVEEIREQNEYSNRRVEFYREDRIKEAQQIIAVESNLVSDAKKRSEKELGELRERIGEERMRRKLVNEKRRRDVSLAIDFSKQHLSVSKALQKHEFLTLRDKILKEDNDFIFKMRQQNERQKELVKKYLEQRNVLRVIQTKNDRTIVERQIKQEKSYEEDNMRNRVNYLRALEFKGRARLASLNPTKVVNLSESFHPKNETEINGEDKIDTQTISTRDNEQSKESSQIKEITIQN